MCARCACPSVGALDDLTREHDAVVELIENSSAASASRDARSAVRLCQDLSGILTPHTAVEEEGLFPAMARDHADHVGVLHAEHDRIHRVVRSVAHGQLTEGWPTRLDEALQLLRTHIRKEEDGVFPAALATLTTADWITVDRIREHVGSYVRPATACRTCSPT
ncbi:MAG: hypothetical protein JWM93_1415 [Frankiales bacterium]|nr:hypothetical protein [Frankiales bacterium]